MDFCTADIDELNPDMICQECKAGIEANADEYDHVSSLQMSKSNIWDIKCPKCGHKFRATPAVEIRWYRVSD